MARVRLTSACYIDSPGPGRIPAGKWVTTTAAELQSGDVFWLNGDCLEIANSKYANN